MKFAKEKMKFAKGEKSTSFSFNVSVASLEQDSSKEKILHTNQNRSTDEFKAGFSKLFFQMVPFRKIKKAMAHLNKVTQKNITKST